MKNFSSKNRHLYISQIESLTFDLVIIGGGITGAGILLDAQSRGLNCALIEMQDFASGTSSRSTKLIHGGLRYLKQMEFKLVAEVGRERAIVYNNGMHVTQAEVMLLPIYKNGSLNYIGASIGLWVYDFLAGVASSEKRKMLTASELSTLEPSLNTKDLVAGAKYFEYRTDDARLTIEVIKKALEFNGVALNYIKAKKFTYSDGKVSGIEAEDMISKKSHTIKAKQIVNASGPWVDTLDVLNDKSKGDKLFLTKGIHIVLDKNKLPLNHSIYFDTDDKRMVFAIPRGDKVYAGTTDTVYEGDIANPAITSGDKEYIVKALNQKFTKINLLSSDVESSWAGLRPLIKQAGKSPSEVSRKEEIYEYTSGLITIAGGKLTGYRHMAEKIVDLVVKRFNKKEIKIGPCITKNLKVSGGNFKNKNEFEMYKAKIKIAAEELELDLADAIMLVNRYGSNADIVLSIFQLRKNNVSPLPLLIEACIVYSIEYEAAFTLTDFFTRRTGALYFDIAWVRKWKAEVGGFMGKILCWTDEQNASFLKELETAIHEASV